jgi:NADH-quinone oxidoreductase subunit N
MNANIMFYCNAFILVVSTICVISANNTIFSLVFLLLSFLSASFLLILLEAEFLGLILIVIYVGAIAILFLFAIMLVETKLTSIIKNKSSLTAPIGTVFGLIIAFPVIGVLGTFLDQEPSYVMNANFYIPELSGTFTEIHTFGNLLYSYYSLHLLITGMLLLAILLGIFRLTYSLFKTPKYQSTFKQLSRAASIFQVYVPGELIKEVVNKYFIKEDPLTQIFFSNAEIAKDIIQLKNFILLPEYLLGLTIICILIATTWLTRNNYGLLMQKIVSEIFGLVMLMMCYLYLHDLLIFNDASFYNVVLNGDLAKLSKFLICFFSAIYFLTTASTLKEQKLTSPEYVLLIAFSMLGLLLICSGNDLLTLYLSLELTSLSSYVLASFKKTQHSNESGLKYFIIGSVSSSFFLLGASFLYLETNSIYLNDYNDLFFYTYNDQPETLNIDLIDVSLSFIFFSLFIKLACAPFHLWSLDVYEESPTNSSFYFAVITKLSIFVVLIKLSFHIFFKLCFLWVTFFTIIGILSAFIGALGGLRQKKLKTLLAYSSTSNMGYALIVLGGFTDEAIWAVLFHIIVYQFSGLCIWGLIIITRLKLKDKKDKYNKELTDLSLFSKANISLAFAFVITLFSLAGIPPLLGFVPKIYIISDVLRCNYYSAAVFLALCSVIAAFYYIRIIKVLFFEDLLTGKLYYPMLGFYSITLSFLVHCLLYAFSDVWSLTIALVGGYSVYVLPWPIFSGAPHEWQVFHRISRELQYELRHARFLNNIGWKDPKDPNPNWFEEAEWAVDSEIFFWSIYSNSRLFQKIVVAGVNRKLEKINIDEDILYALLRGGWKDKDNPEYWFVDSWIELQYLREKAFAEGLEETLARGAVFNELIAEMKKDYAEGRDWLYT